VLVCICGLPTQTLALTSNILMCCLSAIIGFMRIYTF
jgi:hypothetical protein